MRALLLPLVLGALGMALLPAMPRPAASPAPTTPPSPAAPDTVDLTQIYGRIQFVEHFPDFTIQYVEHFPGVE
jgi:hypothetical protein